MELNFNKKTVFVFDLDDTLYKEINFLRSAFHEIACLCHDTDEVFDLMMEWYTKGEDVFQKLLDKTGLDKNKKEILEIYRNHIPDIHLSVDVAAFLDTLSSVGTPICIITDGRSITQHNKLKALGIADRISEIVISEEIGTVKPCANNFIAIEKQFKDFQCIYIGDNPTKDFLAPNSLGWKTIGILDNGENIHLQDLSLSKKYQPQKWVISFEMIKLHLFS
jgi:putative hydrolase of the HAD superfamily